MDARADEPRLDVAACRAGSTAPDIASDPRSEGMLSARRKRGWL
jgi:hypothetical protein